MHQMAWNRTSERLAVLFKGICLYFSEIVVSCVQETSFVMKYKKKLTYMHTRMCIIIQTEVHTYHRYSFKNRIDCFTTQTKN